MEPDAENGVAHSISLFKRPNETDDRGSKSKRHKMEPEMDEDSTSEDETHELTDTVINENDQSLSQLPDERDSPETYISEQGAEQDTMDFTSDDIVSVEKGETFSMMGGYKEIPESGEDLNRLKEFQVLDEIGSDEGGDSEEASSDESGGVADDEIEKMLDEGLPDNFRAPPKEKEKPYITRHKLLMEEKGTNHFEVLPLDWLVVMHNSGIPVYLHKASRVCTLSKPYFLGKGSVRKHEIPVSAVPCLSYRRALEAEEKQKEMSKKNSEQLDEKLNSEVTIPNTCPVGKHNPNVHIIENISIKPSCLSEENNRKINLSNTITVDPHIYHIKSRRLNKESNLHETNLIEPSNSASRIDSNTVEINSQKDSVCIDSVKENTDELTMDDNGIDSTVKDSKKASKSVENEIIEIDKLIAKESGDNEDPDRSLESQQLNDTNCDMEKETTDIDCNADYGKPFPHEIKDTAPINENGMSNTAIEDKETPPSQPVVLPGGLLLPPARVETVQENWKSQHLTHEELTDYCRRLFKFKNVRFVHFRHWSDRRKYTKVKKALQRPTLPEGTKLISIPAQPAEQDHSSGQGILGRPKRAQREWVMNMNGRSYVSVFHEYVRRALQKQPTYEFRQLENAQSPYEATVLMDGMRYGVGRGASKRQAKSNAARESILVLVPEMREQITREEGTKIGGGEADLDFFDMVGIEDPRIMGFCTTTMEPSPHAILRTCLLRNFGTGDRHIQTEMKKLKHEKIEFRMTVGKHTATVVCKNKKIGKQRASQSILQALHPHIKSWGSLLRLYGSRSVKSCRDRKLEEQEITLLQDKATVNQPNYAILAKLKQEMDRLEGRDRAVVSIGTLVVNDELPNLSGASLNNVEL